MAKRPNEEDLSEVVEPSEKRARVAITDLLGDEAGESSISRPAEFGRGEVANGHSSANLSLEVQVLETSNETAKLPVPGPILPSNGNMAPPSDAFVAAYLPSNPGPAVYIVFESQVQFGETSEEVLGVYDSVEKANEAVMRAFLGYHRPGNEADDRERFYDIDGTLSCSFNPEDGEGEMRFWATRHVVNWERASTGEVGRVLQNEFEEAFVGVEEDEEEGEGDEDEE